MNTKMIIPVKNYHKMAAHVGADLFRNYNGNLRTEGFVVTPQDFENARYYKHYAVALRRFNNDFPDLAYLENQKHTCDCCGKKRKAKYMTISREYMQGNGEYKQIWECWDCEEENRGGSHKQDAHQ